MLRLGLRTGLVIHNTPSRLEEIGGTLHAHTHAHTDSRSSLAFATPTITTFNSLFGVFHATIALVHLLFASLNDIKYYFNLFTFAQLAFYAY